MVERIFQLPEFQHGLIAPLFYYLFSVTRLSDDDVADIIDALHQYHTNYLQALFLEARPLTRSEAASIRGYCLLMISLYNGSRAGEHVNMPVEWVLNAPKEPQTGEHIIKVKYRNRLYRQPRHLTKYPYKNS